MLWLHKFEISNLFINTFIHHNALNWSKESKDIYDATKDLYFK